MFRPISSAILLAAILSAAGCGDSQRETPFVSEAVAAPSRTADYGWRTGMAPDAVEDGTVKDYN